MFKDFYLKIKLLEDGILPTRANESDAGYDVYCPLNLSFTILPGEDCKIPLNWQYEFPKGYALIFKEKSGRATKDKLDLGACVGDAGYRGILHAHLFNNSKTTAVHIGPGEKICQFVIVPIWNGEIIQAQELDENTDRGTGGFGSSGLT